MQGSALLRHLEEQLNTAFLPYFGAEHRETPAQLGFSQMFNPKKKKHSAVLKHCLAILSTASTEHAKPYGLVLYIDAKRVYSKATTYLATTQHIREVNVQILKGTPNSDLSEGFLGLVTAIISLKPEDSDYFSLIPDGSAVLAGFHEANKNVDQCTSNHIAVLIIFPQELQEATGRLIDRQVTTFIGQQGLDSSAATVLILYSNSHYRKIIDGSSSMASILIVKGGKMDKNGDFAEKVSGYLSDETEPVKFMPPVKDTGNGNLMTKCSLCKHKEGIDLCEWFAKRIRFDYRVVKNWQSTEFG